MKTRRFTQLLATGAMVASFGLGTALAQNCEAYFPMKKGASFELTHYDSKGKVSSVGTTTITEETPTAMGATVTAHAISKDAKGKELASVDYTVACNGDEFHMDMRGMSLGTQMNNMQGVEGVSVEIEATEMVFPTGLAVGSSLPDASMSMKTTMNGMALMSTNIKIINRKVTAKESKTTPAGTFDCIVIEEDTETQVMGMNNVSHSKAWYSRGAGLVRQELYSKGKMDGYSELTQLSGN